MLEEITEQWLRQRRNRREAVVGRQFLTDRSQSFGDEPGGVGVSAVVGMHGVGFHVFPLQTPRLDLRPQGIAQAEHRESVMPAYFPVPFLGIGAIAVHHELLAHETLEGEAVEEIVGQWLR